ncbi:Ig-like domain-containing protein [[Clostridium] innocuum]|nr:Ig-like domain-containing protein [[Clostridium] innocuum]MCR0575970.1 Ig-like domain-containing protein [[Clostridium] innocuum]
MKKIVNTILTCMLIASCMTISPLQAEEQPIPQDESGLLDYTDEYGTDQGISQQQVVVNKRSRSAQPKEVGYIAVFIEFPDEDMQKYHLDDPASLAAAENLMNGTNVSMTGSLGTGTVLSMKEYIKQYSYNKLDVTTKFFPCQDGKVVSHISSKPRTYYLKQSAENPNGYTPENKLAREKELITEAVNAIQAQVGEQFSADQLDTNHDGVIDAISFFIENKSAMESDGISWQDLLWSHKTENYIEPTILGKRVAVYNLINTYSNASAGGIFTQNRSSYGTIIHEYLHICGLPDLYRATENGKPVGFYDIMASTKGANPQSFLSVMNDDILGWRNPLKEIKQSAETVTVSKPRYRNANEQNAVKLYSPLSEDEYFVAEYYSNPSFEVDNSHADSDGLLLYRVNERGEWTNIGGNPGQQNDYIYVFRPEDTQLNAGGGDLAKAILNKERPAFGKTLDQTADGWDKDTLYLSDGTNSGLSIRVTAQDNASITFDVNISEGLKGEGSAVNPYQITKPEDFNILKQKPNAYYKLMNDIDMNSIDNFQPVESFKGHFDGNNKVIRNVTIKNGEGFFPYIEYKAVVENIVFENLNVTNTQGGHTGAFAGSVQGTVRNVSVKSGTVNGGDSQNSMQGVGGFIGTLGMDGIVEDCYTGASVQSGVNIGGFIGLYQNGNIKYCYANGKVEAGGSYTGGFIGAIYQIDGQIVKPLQSYYDISATGQEKAIGDRDEALGVAGYSWDKEIHISSTDVILPYAILDSSVRPDVKVEDTDIAAVDKNTWKIHGITNGSTKLYMMIPCGKSTIIMESNVLVNGIPESKPIIPEAITLDKTGVSLMQGEHIQLVASVKPDNAVAKLHWSSDNKNVATVTMNGYITAVSTGETDIRVRTDNGLTTKCHVIIKQREVPISSITLSTGALTLTEGDSRMISVVVQPSNTTMSKVVSWSSANSAIARVDTNGKVFAVKPGNTEIIAKASNGIISKCKISIQKRVIPITSIVISNTTLTLTEKDSRTLIASVYPSNTNMNKGITWISSNRNIASVDGNGRIYAVSPGSVSIAAKSSNGNTASCKVNVQKRNISIASIKISQQSVALQKGKSIALSASVSPSNTTMSKAIKWNTSNGKVVAVDNSGKVTAKSAGKAIITARSSNGKTVNCTVTVTNPAPAINKKSLTLYKKKTYTLKINNNSNKVSWSSSNKKIATVNSKGKVTAKKAGKVTITGKIGKKKYTCKITVKNPYLKISKSNVVIKKGKSVKLSGSTAPKATIKWSSGKKSVATVSNKGSVKGRKKGTAYIYAKANGLTKKIKVTVK